MDYFLSDLSVFFFSGFALCCAVVRWESEFSEVTHWHTKMDMGEIESKSGYFFFIKQWQVFLKKILFKLEVLKKILFHYKKINFVLILTYLD